LDHEFSDSSTLFVFLSPVFSSLSAAPDFVLFVRLPCFAMVSPALAAAIAALVAMF
jgi:hypothetical protein